MLVFSGGGLGSLLRWLASLAASACFPGAYGAGTVAVNALGSLAIGFLGALFSRGILPEDLRLFFVTGLLGGLTTFSAFSLETLTAFQCGESLKALGFLAANLVPGILLCLLGFWLASRV